MALAVVDASFVVDLLVDHPRSPAARALFEGVDAVAPDLLDAEVANAVAGLRRRGELSEERAVLALEQLATMRVERFSHTALLGDVWALRHNLGVYDAFYVALARTLGCQLVTCDRAFARAPGLGITVTVVGS